MMMSIVMERPNIMIVLLASWILAIVAAASICRLLGSLHAYGAHTQSQIAFAIASCGMMATWFVAELCLFFRLCGDDKTTGSSNAPAIELQPKAAVVGVATLPDSEDVSTENISAAKDLTQAAEEGAVVETEALIHGNVRTPISQTDLIIFLRDARSPLRAISEFIAIIATLYLCDRTNILPKGKKMYDPMQFWGLWALLVVAALFTIRTLAHAKPMQREQTDEWKGWMQLMFVLYHYFAEKEVYNAIRLFIAAYVWMTGYGNFSLYMRGKSFTIGRTLQMLFRLNFLAFGVCIALNDEYMLYYIAPMHTLFTIFVILALYVAQSLNNSRWWVYVKLVLLLFGIILLYDGPSILFRSVFGSVPVIKQLFAFHDPVHPEFADELHEWHFRSGLDRFIWIIGMLSALHLEDFEAIIVWLEKLPPWRLALCRVAILVCLACPLVVWWHEVFRLEKTAYNTQHPFTSFLPILAYIILRNFTPALRQRYLYMFAYLGRVTLETYILQFHVWMKTTGVNGSPKSLLVVIPGSYWANFVLTSAVYLFLSVRLSQLTVVLKDALIPGSMQTLKNIWLGLAGMAAFCWILAYGFLQVS